MISSYTNQILRKVALVSVTLILSYGATYQTSIHQMVFVQGGQFFMGEIGGNTNPAHNVTVSSFYIAPYKVTVLEWREFTKAIQVEFDWNRDYIFEGSSRPYKWADNDPIAFVTWYEAVLFCNWLSKKVSLQPAYSVQGRTGYSYVNGRSRFTRAKITWNRKANGFRLPTEAEWEYAARGGVKSLGTIYPGSNNIDEVAWYTGNANNTIMPVGLKAANELGLYDMGGDVSEWCWDFYDSRYYKNSPSANPAGPNVGYAPEWLEKDQYECSHSVRGGNVLTKEEYSTVYMRTLSEDINRSWIGMRIVRNVYGD